MVFELGIRMVHMVEPEFPVETILISVSDGMGVRRMYRVIVAEFTKRGLIHSSNFVTLTRHNFIYE